MQMMDGLSQNQLRYFFKKHDMQLIKKIGSGSFGTVFLANCVQNDYLPFAVKIISKKQFAKHPSLQKYLTAEVSNMEVVKNPHVVKLHEKFQENNFFFLVMEYCELGNLYTYQFTQNDKTFKLNDALKIFVEILKGVNFIHKANVIHRDIKCENILLKKKKNQGFTCKIGDFGFSKSVEQATKSHCGTPNFMAPQILAGKAYDKQVDIWSLGVILFYMLFADYPFKGMNLLYDIQMRCSNKYSLIDEISSSPSIKKNKSISQKQLILLHKMFQNIFVINPKLRIQLKEILQNQLFGPFKEIIANDQQTTPQLSQSEELAKFVFGKIDFIENVIKEIIQIKVSSDSVLMKLNQYFICRVGATMLRVLYKDLGKTDSGSKSNIKKEISVKHQKLQGQMKQFIKQISDCDIKPYKLKEKVFQFSSTQYFESFKDDYRVLVGMLFAQVHNNKSITSAQLKEKLKLKILCCHTINRVFQNGMNEEYWLYLREWIQKHKITEKLNKQKNMTNLSFNFEYFGQWIEQQARQNIVKTISLINNKYYNTGNNKK